MASSSSIVWDSNPHRSLQTSISLDSASAVDEEGETGCVSEGERMQRPTSLDGVRDRGRGRARRHKQEQVIQQQQQQQQQQQKQAGSDNPRRSLHFESKPSRLSFQVCVSKECYEISFYTAWLY